MRRRTLVTLIAIVGVAIVVVAGLVGVQAYLDSVKRIAAPAPTASLSKATQSAYLAAVHDWPYALPPGEALPTTPPGSIGEGEAAVRAFVSFFFRCSWQHSYLDGPAHGKSLALTNLVLWARLPASISSADNSDGAWMNDLIIPAVHGDDSAMKRVYRADCRGATYATEKTTPARGLVIDRPQAQVISTASILDLCADVSATVPCDPAFGPNRTIDLGSRPGARGTVTVDGAGVPRAYLVAAGDSPNAVAERFGGANIWGLNCYRRTDLHLYIGDTLNLDYYTVKTVGSENGSTVSHNAQSAAACLTQSAVPPEQITP